MGRGSGEQRVAVSVAGAGSFRMGKHGKAQIGIPFTPEKAFVITVGLIVSTIVLHIVGRVFIK